MSGVKFAGVLVRVAVGRGRVAVALGRARVGVREGGTRVGVREGGMLVAVAVGGTLVGVGVAVAGISVAVGDAGISVMVGIAGSTDAVGVAGCAVGPNSKLTTVGVGVAGAGAQAEVMHNPSASARATIKYFGEMGRSSLSKICSDAGHDRGRVAKGSERSYTIVQNFSKCRAMLINERGG